MSRALLAILFCACANFLSAQNCDPDLTFADSTAGVYPLPYHPEESPNGGIKECAVIGQPFDFTFTIVVNDTLTYQGLSFPLDSVVVNSVSGLPTGVSYVCEPGNCHFKANSIGCAKLLGIPTNANAPGIFNLNIAGLAYVNGSSFGLQINFPDANLAPGTYTIQLNASANDPCAVTSTNELRQSVSIQTVPNPTSGMTQIKINSKVTGQFQFRVVDLLGQSMEQRQIGISKGENNLEFDASLYANGLYFVQIQSEAGQVTQKIIVQH
ncbi:MAG: T9SS type A sorting domain-containing protein [Saprospiraceae bacterium]|nr:T9SS type A sorting domain-containing protein [Saprospiraceae bacterium]